MACSFLIVDADRNFREALAIALRLDGHRVEGVDAAEDGLAALARGGHRCCVVDAHLPGGDAVLVAAGRAGLRRVLVSPYPDLLAAAARRHAGAELLEKPFRASELASGCRGGAPVAAAGAAVASR